jgi:copper resistance protein C
MRCRVLAGLALAASLGFAHAVLVECTPTPNGTVAGPKVDIRLRFNSRIDSGRSRIALVLPDRSVKPLTIEQQVSPAILRSVTEGLEAGVYTLQWQVLAADGHITRGEVPFHVK